VKLLVGWQSGEFYSAAVFVCSGGLW